MIRYCHTVGHGGSQYNGRTWHCNHGLCGGAIQAWRHHIEEEWKDTQAMLLAEERRWQRHYGLPETPDGDRPPMPRMGKSLAVSYIGINAPYID